MGESTKKRLAAALREIGLDEMARKAEGGYYDDFESPLATPCIQLVADLQKINTKNARLLAKRAMDGEFDGTRAEGEAWLQREGRHLLTPQAAEALFPKSTRLQ